MILDPELQAAVAASQPAPTAPVVPSAPSQPTAPIGALPTTPPANGGFAPLGSPAPSTPNSTAPVAATPARSAVPPKNPTFGEKLHNALLSNPLNFRNPLANVAVAGIDALAGVTSALSNVAAPEDSGMGVLAGTARNIEAQKAARAAAVVQARKDAAAQKQIDFENQIKTQNAATDEQKAKAAAVTAQAKMIQAMRMDSDSDGLHNTKMAESGSAIMKSILDSGGQLLTPTPITDAQFSSPEFQAKLPQDPRSGGPDYSQFLLIPAGNRPMLGPDGTPKIGDNGEPMFEHEVQIVTYGKPVTLDAKESSFLTDNNVAGEKFEVGQVLPAQLYAQEYSKALTVQGANLNVDKTRAQIADTLAGANLKKFQAYNQNLSAQEKSQNLRTSALVAKYLARPDVHGDAVLMLDAVKNSKDAGMVGAIQKLYGPGVLEKIRNDNLLSLKGIIAEADKTIQNAVNNPPLSSQRRSMLQNKLADPKTDAQTKADIQKQLKDDQDDIDAVNQAQIDRKAAKQKINLYTGLHPTDPDQFAATKQKLQGLSPDAQVAQIMLWPGAPDGAKKYLLMNMGLPVPPSLRNVQPIAPAPAPQQ